MVVPGRGGWGGWQSRETNARERLRGTAELGFPMGLSEKWLRCIMKNQVSSVSEVPLKCSPCISFRRFMKSKIIDF